MPPEGGKDWELLETWFDRLSGLSPEEGDRQLTALADDNPRLAAELRRMLEHDPSEFFSSLESRIHNARPQVDSQALFKPGDRVNQFEILAELGRGGMGVVYSARDTALDRDVALKFLPQRIAGSPLSRERFLREARAVSHVDHPNICTIYELGSEPGGRSFIAMALYRGHTLRDVMGKGLADHEQAKRWMAQAASGLGAAHAEGVIHRDIKPDNLFITEGEQLKILDFGIARALQDDVLTRDGTTLGTLNYMSPEQLRGAEADGRSDIWSLGIVMYELLEGRRPYEAPHRDAVIHAILNEPVPPFSVDGPEESQLRSAMAKCLQKDPNDRYESCGKLLRDLGATAATNRLPRIPAAKRAPLWLWLGLAGTAVALLLAWIVTGPLSSGPDATSVDPITIVVSPFRDLTPNARFQAIGEGLASDLLARLGQLQSLRLIRAGQVPPEDMRSYGDSLGAAFLLGGEIQGGDGAVRVHTSLMDLSDGTQRWAASFDRLATRPLDLQTEIAAAIVETLTLELSVEDRATLDKRNRSLPAQDAYLSGVSHALRRTPADLAAAVGHFQEAIRLDRDFADAWSGFAYARMLQGGTAYSPESGEDAFEEARAAAAIALDLDSGQALAMTTLASIYSEFDWDVGKADSVFQMTLALNPSSAEARHLYASHLAESGRLDEAAAQQRRASLLDPESLIQPTNLGLIQFYQRKNREALKTFDEVLERDPTFYMAHLNRSLLLMEMDRPEEALEALDATESLVGRPPVVRALSASAYALGGQEARALELLSDLEAESQTAYVSPPLFAQVYLALADTARALDYLERGLEERDVYMTVMQPWPFVDVLRDNPRFQRVLERMGR